MRTSTPATELGILAAQRVRLLWVASVAALLLGACQMETQQSRVDPSSKKPAYPRLESQLSQLVERALASPDQAGTLAAQAPLSEGDAVAVSIRMGGAVDEVVRYLASQGVTPAHVEKDVIEAYVPLLELPGLVAQTGVARVEMIRPPRPDSGAGPIRDP